MKTITLSSENMHRPIALLVTGALAVPTLVGCAGAGTNATPPPVDRSTATRPPAMGAPRASNSGGGMSTKQKVVLLAGAAALYYMYKKKQNAQGQAVQYYRSESNGRIYYRDPKKNNQAVWVTPPESGIHVPAEQAQEYSGYSGFNGATAGREFGGYGPSGQTF